MPTVICQTCGSTNTCPSCSDYICPMCGSDLTPKSTEEPKEEESNEDIGTGM